MKAARTWASGLFCALAVTSGAGIPTETIVQPLSARTHFEWTTLRDPGGASSNGRWYEFEQPDWVGIFSFGSHNGDTYHYRSGAGIHTGFFKTTDNVVTSTIRGYGEAYSNIALEDDNASFTTTTGVSSTQMAWRVIEPVWFTLSGELRVEDLVAPSLGLASAEAGIGIHGGSMHQTIALSSFEESTLTFEWRFHLAPGVYRLESWADSFALALGDDEQISSMAWYSYEGSFSLVPGPGTVAPGLVAACAAVLRRRRPVELRSSSMP